jgi:pyridinium-3,5-bisthiocarboxylic acid mononucleotide nickel chelatase
MASTAGRILVFDPRIAGISGDMIVAGLLDLGASPHSVLTAMRVPQDCVPGCTTMDISVTDVYRNGIKAKKLNIRIEEQTHHMAASDLLQAASHCLQRLSLSDAAQTLVMSSLDCLVSAEATVHG